MKNLKNIKDFLEVEELSKLEEVSVQGGAEAKQKQKQQQQQTVGDTVYGQDLNVGL